MPNAPVLLPEAPCLLSLLINSPSLFLHPIHGSEGIRLKQSPPPPPPSSPHRGPKGPTNLGVLGFSEGGGRKHEMRCLQLLTGFWGTLAIQNELSEVPPDLRPMPAPGAGVPWQGWESRRAESYFIVLPRIMYSSICIYSHHHTSTHCTSTHRPERHHQKRLLPEDSGFR